MLDAHEAALHDARFRMRGRIRGERLAHPGENIGFALLEVGGCRGGIQPANEGRVFEIPGEIKIVGAVLGDGDANAVLVHVVDLLQQRIRMREIDTLDQNVRRSEVDRRGAFRIDRQERNVPFVLGRGLGNFAGFVEGHEIDRHVEALRQLAGKRGGDAARLAIRAPLCQDGIAEIDRHS